MNKNIKVKHYQLYNSEVCEKSGCKNFYHKSCFGNPYDCDINQKEGYPKEIPIEKS